MSAPADLLDRVMSLPADQRADVAQKLLLSLEPPISESADAVERAWAAEIDARLDRADADPASVVDWRIAIQRVRESLKHKAS